MFGIPFWFLGGYISLLLIGLEIDIGYSFDTFLLTQGNLEASTLAGNAQQQEVIMQASQDGPTQYGYYLLQDGTPEQVAQDTWNKNVANFGPGPWSNVTPTWSLARNDTTHTPPGQLDTVTGTVSETVPMAMSNQDFGTNLSNTVQDSVSSTVHNTVTYP